MSDLRSQGFTLRDSLDMLAGIVDPNSGLHRIRYGQDTLPYLDGMLRQGAFSVCPRSASTTEVLLDTGANVNAAGSGWEDVLTILPGPGRVAHGVGAQPLQSLGQATLRCLFPPPAYYVSTHVEPPGVAPEALAPIDAAPGDVFADAVHSLQAKAQRTPGRYRRLDSADLIHRRLGISDPLLMRKLATTASGVDSFAVDGTRRVLSPSSRRPAPAAKSRARAWTPPPWRVSAGPSAPTGLATRRPSCP